MKLRLITTMGLALFVIQAQAATTVLKTEQDKVSYTIGYDMGDNFKTQGLKVDPTIVAVGIKDGMSGGKGLLTKDEMHATLLAFQKKLLAEHEAKMTVAAEDNLTTGDKFLAKNKDAKGITTLPSGLQYKVVTPGTGAKPTADDVVTVEYTGYLVDPTKADGQGEVFDSSKKHGQAISFPVSGVIKGWTEGLQLMKTGGTWMFYIPADLAYGKQAVGPIGPNQALIFEVELVSIKDAAKK